MSTFRDEIDPEIQDEIDHINNDFGGKFTTMISCSGHGKYPATIVVINNISKCFFEWFTGRIPYFERVCLKKGEETQMCRYVKDDEGIPRLVM